MNSGKQMLSDNRQDYKCGVRVGQRLRLIRELVATDWRGFPNGRSWAAGSIWKVDVPNGDCCRNDPETIWLIDDRGEPHTWEAPRLFDWFEQTDA